MNKSSLLVSFLICLSVLSFSYCSKAPYQPNLKDAYSWLVPKKNKRILAWTTKQSTEAKKTFSSDTQFKIFYDEVLKIRQSKDRIPYGSIRGNYYYNFWKDKKYKRGVWRRIRLDQFKKGSKQWEILLNLDQLAKRENRDWTFQEANCLGPSFQRCILLLSLGGSDEAVMREFDLVTKSFPKDGFRHKAARTQIQWINKDKIFIGSDFGKGTLSKMKYPLQIRLWKRGTLLNKANVVYQAAKNTVGSFLDNTNDIPTNIFLVADYISFRDKEYWLFNGKRFSQKLNLPIDSRIRGVLGKNVVISTLSDWHIKHKVFKAGSVLIVDLSALAQGKIPLPTVLFSPEKRSEVVSNVYVSKSYIWINLLNDVKNQLYRYEKIGSGWKSKKVKMPSEGRISLIGVTPDTDSFFVSYESFLSANTLHLISNGSLSPQFVVKLPDWFNSKKMIMSQKWTHSKDGTKVPYFLIHKKEMRFNGKNPTLLWGYGAGNEIMSPRYLGNIGKSWVERGGVFVSAVLRGGGELGPLWRKNGMKIHKQNTFNDFIAIAESLIKKKITSPKYLGIYGKSWGGLLVGAAFTQKPELFGAVFCEMPMLDMLNYTLLPIGEGWVGEFGNPKDPISYKILKSYSPYHNVKVGQKYPTIFFISSTNDDRMHPAHARRMAAKMQKQGHKVYYLENPRGGHRGYANNEEYAFFRALRFNFFAKQLGLTAQK